MDENDGTDDTSIRLKISTWKRLSERKDRPDKSFDDVINEVLDRVEEVEAEGNPKPATAHS